MRPLGTDAEHEAPAAKGMLHSHAFFVCCLGGRSARTVRHDVEAGRVEAEERTDLVTRRSRAGKQGIGSLRRRPDRQPKSESRRTGERLHPQECDVVQRDHRGRPGSPDRRDARQAVQEVEALPPRAPGKPCLLHHQPTGSLTLVERQVLDLRKVRPTIPPKRVCPGPRGHDDESRVGKLRRQSRNEPAQIRLGAA